MPDPRIDYHALLVQQSKDIEQLKRRVTALARLIAPNLCSVCGEFRGYPLIVNDATGIVRCQQCYDLESAALSGKVDPKVWLSTIRSEPMKDTP